MTEPTAGIGVDDGERAAVLTERAPGRLASYLAVGLGVCVCIVNLALAVRLWKALFVRASSGSLLFALIIVSFFLGAFLIAYGTTLGRSRTTDGRGLWYTSAVVALLIGVGALALTVWAASIVDPVKPLPDTPKSCIDLYQQALPIHKASPNFRFPASEPDQRRCDINSLLKTAAK
ncbi:hypothetical protein [Mycolicibacterium aichiense]|nr:hypothetical protein [Mycolicibacterium aichiense]MCV7017890.1 hypothetical protein [Mycolicibacterium aichiense]